MDDYLSWKEKTISDFSPENISTLYDDGFVFTRLGKGVMIQTRSVRINLDKFELSSENKRVLRKTEDVKLNIITLPHPDYDWHIHKLGVDFYTKKFGEKTFSANKIKELLTSNKSNYNLLLEYRHCEEQGDAAIPLITEKNGIASPSVRNDNVPVGYCVCYQNKNLLHYAYPFYDLETEINNLGIGMMTKTIISAKDKGLKYVYLGSAQNEKAIYKTQFTGFEWFDGEVWQNDIEKLKIILAN